MYLAAEKREKNRFLIKELKKEK